GVASITISGKAAIGAAIDLGAFDTTAKAFIAGTATLNAAGDVHLFATTEERLHSIAASLAVAGKEGIAGSGSASSMNVHHDVESFVGAGATVTTPDSLFLDADDDTLFLLIAGGAGGGQDAGVGLSAANANIIRTLKAYLGDGATVFAGGNGSGIDDPEGS